MQLEITEAMKILTASLPPSFLIGDHNNQPTRGMVQENEI
jgi:hypothetical protein